MKTDHLIIFDTTMRDGEQSPGASMTREEKLRIARALERMKVDVIEAGFPAASNGDFEAVKAVAAAIKDSTVAGLCSPSRMVVSKMMRWSVFMAAPGACDGWIEACSPGLAAGRRGYSEKGGLKCARGAQQQRSQRQKRQAEDRREDQDLGLHSGTI